MSPSTETSGKPADIPQDVWDAACKVAEPINDTTILHSLIVEGAVRAIMAAKAEEREACAAVAEEYVWDDHALAQATEIGRAVHYQAAEIVAAIRKRGEG